MKMKRNMVSETVIAHIVRFYKTIKETGNSPIWGKQERVAHKLKIKEFAKHMRQETIFQTASQ